MAVTPPEPALLVASILGRTIEQVDVAVGRFAEQFGPIAFTSAPLEFHWTSYYRDELGEDPKRRVIAVDRFEDTSRLPEIKRATCRLEIALSRPGGSREVNIDPGFLSAEQLVLASTKRRAHRIHLGRGIYADLMLLYGSDGFAPLPWTYPDYGSLPLRELFGQLRELLLAARRERRQP